MKKNILVAQSGGPTVAINASLAGVLKAGLDSEEIGIVYGGLNGIEGILANKIVKLSELCNTEEDVYKLMCTPSMALGSCRLKMKTPQDAPEVYSKLLEIFKEYNIGAFFYIGGNDSMDTVAKVSKYCVDNGYPVNVVGVPKTIDNDLVMTDHTPGFGSAAKYVISSVAELNCDTAVYNMESVVILEIMGRDAGWLTASAGVARVNGGAAPHLIYLPEIAFDKEQFKADLKKAVEKHKTVIVATSEGIRDKDGNYAQATDENAPKDAFGHVMLGGTGKYLESIVKNELGIKVRSIELSTLQRAASHSASKADLEESFEVGKSAVKMALEGKTAVMAAIKRLTNKPYSFAVEGVPVSEVANAVKKFPANWLNADYSLTEEAMDYFLPLIQGEPELPRKNGLQDYFIINK